MGGYRKIHVIPSAVPGGTVSPAGSVGAGRSPPESCALMEGDSPSQEGGFPRGPRPPWERRKKNPPPVAARPSPAHTVTTGGGKGEGSSLPARPPPSSLRDDTVSPAGSGPGAQWAPSRTDGRRSGDRPLGNVPLARCGPHRERQVLLVGTIN